MRNGWTLFVAFALCAQTQQIGVALEEEMRQWATSNGKYSTVGRLVDYERPSSTVTIEKEDHRRIQIDLHDLSKDDQRHVRRFHAARTKRLRGKVKQRGEDQGKRNERESKKKLALRSPALLKMYGVNWVPEIETALAIAGGETTSKSDDRPVMWFRVLGDLAGYM